MTWRALSRSKDVVEFRKRGFQLRLTTWRGLELFMSPPHQHVKLVRPAAPRQPRADILHRAVQRTRSNRCPSKIIVSNFEAFGWDKYRGL
jgi:hypothetical protein